MGKISDKTEAFTDPGVRRMKPRDKAYEKYDGGCSHLKGVTLILVVGTSGTKTFYLKYGRKKKRLGQFDAVSVRKARQEAHRIWELYTKGIDPRTEERERQRVTITVEELFQRYLEEHSRPKKRSSRDDERCLKKDGDLAPVMDMKAVDLTSWMVRPLLKKIADPEEDGGRDAPRSADLTRLAVSAAYNWAIREEILPDWTENPASRIGNFYKLRPRERYLSEREIARLWAVLEAEDSVMAAVFKMLLLTGQRSNEVKTMRWSDIDREHWWMIPGEVMKKGEDHRVYFSSQARKVLKKLEDLRTSRWVFPSWKKDGHHLTALNKSTLRYWRKSGVDFRPHDLRRTVSAHLEEMGVPENVIDAILNHAPRGTRRRHYGAKLDRQKKDALTTWGNRIEELVAAD